MLLSPIQGAVVTELLRQAFERLELMPSDMQDEIARALLGLAENEAEEVEAEHRAAVEEGRAQAARGEFSVLSPEDAVRAAFRRHP